MLWCKVELQVRYIMGVASQSHIKQERNQEFHRELRATNRFDTTLRCYLYGFPARGDKRSILSGTFLFSGFLPPHNR